MIRRYARWVQAPILYSDRLVLDQPHAGDIAAITQACQDPVFEQFMTLPWPYLPEHAEFFVHALAPEGWKSGEEATWAIRPRTHFGDAAAPDNQSAPLMGVVSVRKTLQDTGFWLAAEHRGRGVMPEALAAVIGWLQKSQYVDPAHLTWSCVVGNYASAAVARKSGFSFTGIGPASVRHRDGSYPESWHAIYQVGATVSGSPEQQAAWDSWPDFTYPQG